MSPVDWPYSPKFRHAGIFNNQGQLQISSLSHHDDVGAIIHRTLRADGTMTTSTITLMPKLSSLESCYSAIVPTEDDESYRLVLNMAAQESYSLDQEADFQLPAIVDRLKSTIPVHVTHTQPLRLTDGTFGGKRRLNDDGDLGGSSCNLTLAKRPRETE